MPIPPVLRRTALKNPLRCLASAHAATPGYFRTHEPAPELGSPRRTGPALIQPAPVNFRRFGSLVSASFLWSWRRDLNPRPSDYKSDALPAELRQLIPTRKPSRDTENYADTLQLSAYTAQKSRLAHRRTRSKRGKTGNRSAASALRRNQGHRSTGPSHAARQFMQPRPQPPAVSGKIILRKRPAW